MPRKQCQYKGCGCSENLTEITAAEEDFCRCLVDAQFKWSDFKRRPDSGVFKVKTWLCEEHLPEGLAYADLLGARVAKIIGGELFFGEVSHVAGFSRESRHLATTQQLCKGKHDYHRSCIRSLRLSRSSHTVQQAAPLSCRLCSSGPGCGITAHARIYGCVRCCAFDNWACNWATAVWANAKHTTLLRSALARLGVARYALHITVS